MWTGYHDVRSHLISKDVPSITPSYYLFTLIRWSRIDRLDYAHVWIPVLTVAIHTTQFYHFSVSKRQFLLSLFFSPGQVPVKNHKYKLKKKVVGQIFHTELLQNHVSKLHSHFLVIVNKLQSVKAFQIIYSTKFYSMRLTLKGKKIGNQLNIPTENVSGTILNFTSLYKTVSKNPENPCTTQSSSTLKVSLSYLVLSIILPTNQKNISAMISFHWKVHTRGENGVNIIHSKSLQNSIWNEYLLLFGWWNVNNFCTGAKW